jgi:hypothetical protein
VPVLVPAPVPVPVPSFLCAPSRVSTTAPRSFLVVAGAQPLLADSLFALSALIDSELRPRPLAGWLLLLSPLLLLVLPVLLVRLLPGGGNALARSEQTTFRPSRTIVSLLSPFATILPPWRHAHAQDRQRCPFLSQASRAITL